MSLRKCTHYARLSNDRIRTALPQIIEARGRYDATLVELKATIHDFNMVHDLLDELSKIQEFAKINYHVIDSALTNYQTFLLMRRYSNSLNCDIIMKTCSAIRDWLQLVWENGGNVVQLNNEINMMQIYNAPKDNTRGKITRILGQVPNYITVIFMLGWSISIAHLWWDDYFLDGGDYIAIITGAILAVPVWWISHLIFKGIDSVDFTGSITTNQRINAKRRDYLEAVREINNKYIILRELLKMNL